MTPLFTLKEDECTSTACLGEVYEMGFTTSLGLFAGQHPQPGEPGGRRKDSKEPLTLTSDRSLNKLLRKYQVSIPKEHKIRPGTVTLFH